MSEKTPEIGGTAQVALVGAGPIGVELAVALKRAGVDYQHFEAGQLGHTLTWWPRDTIFFSSPERIMIAGVPLHTAGQRHPTGEEYLAYLRAVVQQFDLQIHFYQPVRRIERLESGFWLITERHGRLLAYRAEKVVLAVGGMHFPNWLGIPGEDLPHVSHYYRDPHDYFRQEVLVVGGRNSAVEAALRCWRAGAKVTLSYRGPAIEREQVKPALLADLDTVVREGNLRLLTGTVPVEIKPGEVELACTGPDGQPAGGRRMRVKADFVLLMTGYSMDTTLFEQLGVNLTGEERAPQYNPETMETNVPGVFVAGVAAGGRQRKFRHFIETSHVHIPRIFTALTGQPYTGPLVEPGAKTSETA